MTYLVKNQNIIIAIRCNNKVYYLQVGVVFIHFFSVRCDFLNNGNCMSSNDWHSIVNMRPNKIKKFSTAILYFLYPAGQPNKHHSLINYIL